MTAITKNALDVLHARIYNGTHHSARYDTTTALTCYAMNKQGKSFASIGEHLSIPKSTAHHLACLVRSAIQRLEQDK